MSRIVIPGISFTLATVSIPKILHHLQHPTFAWNIHKIIFKKGKIARRFKFRKLLYWI